MAAAAPDHQLAALHALPAAPWRHSLARSGAAPAPAATAVPFGRHAAQLAPTTILCFPRFLDSMLLLFLLDNNTDLR